MPSPTLGVHTILAGAAATSFTTAAVTTQATGSTFEVTYEGGGTPTGVPTDNFGNTYVQKATDTSGGFGLNLLFAWVCVNGTGGASHQATVTTGAGNAVVGFKEILGATGVDQASANGSSGSFASVACPQVTTTAANEAVSCFYGSTNSNTLTSITDSGSGFTISDSQLTSTSPNGAMSFATAATVGTYGDTFTQSTADSLGLSSVTISYFGSATAAPPTGQAPKAFRRRPLRLGTPLSRLRSGIGSTAAAVIPVISSDGGALAYSWAGTTATTSSLVNSDGGATAYSWAGTASTISQVINTDGGALAYSWAGTTSTLGGPINAVVGAYSWTGTTSTLGGPINATAGALTWSGTTSALSQLINSDGGATAYSWTGTTAGITQLLIAVPGAYTWIGTTSSLGSGIGPSIVANINSRAAKDLSGGDTYAIALGASVSMTLAAATSSNVALPVDGNSRVYPAYIILADSNTWIAFASAGTDVATVAGANNYLINGSGPPRLIATPSAQLNGSVGAFLAGISTTGGRVNITGIF